MSRHRWVPALVLVLAGCGGGGSGNVAGFCDLNSELEAYYTGSSFPPLEIREEAGRPKLLEALRSNVVMFDFDEVAAFGETFDDFVEAAPDGIRSSVGVIDEAISPLIDAGTDQTIDLFEGAFVDEEAVSAGFEVEYWVSENCPG